MEYLSETCPIYTRKAGDWVAVYEHSEVEWNEYEGAYYVKSFGEWVEVWHEQDRPAKWWCVAVYETERAYGGPEEGGWWYDCGVLVNHAMVRFFDNYKDAYDYTQELWKWCMEQNRGRGDVRLAVRGFTEQMPDTHFPKNRPYYH